MADLTKTHAFSVEALTEASARLRKMEMELLQAGRIEDSISCAYGDFFALVVRRWLLESGTLEQAFERTIDEVRAVEILQA